MKYLQNMVRRKWKIIEVVQVGGGGSYWDFEFDILDFTNIGEDALFIVQEGSNGTDVIRFQGTQAYLEVLSVSATSLKLALNLIDPKTANAHLLSEVYCQAVD